MTTERPQPDIGELMAKGERFSRLVAKRDRLVVTLTEMAADPSVSVIRRRRLEGVRATVEEARDRFGNLLSQTTEQLDQVLPQAINQAQEELREKGRDLARVTNMAARGRLSLSGDDLKAFGEEITELETRLQRLEVLRNRRGEPIPSAEPSPTSPPTPDAPPPVVPQAPEVSPEQTSLRASQREPFQVEIGGGVIDGKGRATRILLETVIGTSRDKPLGLAQLAVALYGVSDKKALSKATSNISAANLRVLSSRGLAIGWDWSAGKVWLEVLKPAEAEPQIVRIEVLDMVADDVSHIRVGGRIIGLSERELAVLSVLGGRVGEQIISGELSRLALSDPRAEHSRLRDVVASLKSKLNLSGGAEVVVSGGRSNQAWVMLQGAEVVFPEVPQEEEAFPLETSRVNALRLVLENPNVSLEQVKAVLDPEGKFTPERMVVSLRRTPSFLGERVKRGIITIPEIELIESVLAATGKSVPMEGISEMARRLEKWLKTQAERVRTEVLEPEPVTLLEASALAKLIEDRVGVRIGINGSSFVFEIAQEKRPIFVNLRDFWEQNGSAGPVVPFRELVNSALFKISAVVGMGMEGKVRYIIDRHPENIAELLDWFYFQNTERMQGVLADFLSGEVEKNWREGRGGLVEDFERVWPQTVESTPDRAVFEPPERSSVPAEPKAGVEPVVQPQVTVEPPSPSSRVQQLEKRLPDVRDQIERVVARLAQQNSLEPVTGARVSQIFNSVTATVMGKAEERRFIAVQRVHSGGFEYPVEDVVVLVVMNENRGVSWDRRLVGTLRDLANTELQKKIKELEKAREEARKKKLEEQRANQGQ